MTLGEGSADIWYCIFNSTWAARPHFVANQAQQILTPTDEKAVARWIRKLENCGFPPKVEHVRQAAGNY